MARNKKRGSPKNQRARRPAEAVPQALSQVQELLERLEKSQEDSEIFEAGQALLSVDPTSVAGLHKVAMAHGRRGEPKMAAELLERAVLLAPERTDLLVDLIHQLGLAGKLHAALCAARRWTQLKPKDPQALGRLAGLLGTLNYDSLSRHYAMLTAEAMPLSVSTRAEKEKMSVLILLTIASGSYRYNPKTGKNHIGEGHNNLSSMLDEQHITLYTCHVDAFCRKDRLMRKLPKADLVFNNISDPERCRNALETAEHLCGHLAGRDGTQVINDPRRVLECTREENWRRLKDAPGIIMPKSVNLGELKGHISDTIRSAIQENNMQPPVIMRAAGFQAGRHMHLLTDLDNLNVTLQKPAMVYLIEYVDVSFTDDRDPGKYFYPKYRAILVGDKLYPAHLRVAQEFNVFKKNADPVMDRNPWIFDIQKDYINNPENHFSPGTWDNVEKACKLLNLEYMGLDFASATEPGKEGQIIVFEANSAMRSWMTELPQGDPVQKAWVKIALATHELFCRKSGVAPWDFKLPAAGVQQKN